MRLFVPLALLLLAPGGLAEEDDVPLVFFRQPDRQTKKEIVHAVSSKGLGSGTRAVRRQSRARLVEIGPWAVPFLSEALTKRTTGASRVRMNAAITLAWIRDRAAVPALNAGAEGDGNVFVRRTCCLALGKFRESEAVVRILKSRQREAARTKTAAMLALGKSSDRDLHVAREEIAAAAEAMPKDPSYAAAILIATTLLLEDDPRIVDRFLGHKDKLLRRAAVTCRLVRPVRPTQVGLLEKRLTVERDSQIRALLYHALSAVGGAEKLNERLLNAATKTREKKPARIAAAIELAGRYNAPANHVALLGALGRIKSRNDPLAGPLIFALAQTRAPKAIAKLRKILRTPGSGTRSFYAAGSLLYLACHGMAKELEARTIIDEIAATNIKEPWLQRLVGIVRSLEGEPPAVLWEKALAGDKKRESLKEISAAWLWTVSEEDRAWTKLNLLLPYIFELDDIVDTRDMSEHAPTDPPKGQGATDDAGGGDDGTHDDGAGGDDEGGIKVAKGKGAASGKADEQDLIDFLKDPYFVREDLRGGQ